MGRRGGGHTCPVVFVCVWRPSWRRLLLYVVAGPCLEVSNKLLFWFASPYNPGRLARLFLLNPWPPTALPVCLFTCQRNRGNYPSTWLKPDAVKRS